MIDAARSVDRPWRATAPVHHPVYNDTVITAGSLDQVARAISLRGYDHLEDLHRRRWRAPLPFARAPYTAFIERVCAFARSQQFSVVIEDVAEPAPRGVSRAMLVVGGIAVVTGVAAAVLAYRHFR